MQVTSYVAGNVVVVITNDEWAGISGLPQSLGMHLGCWDQILLDWHVIVGLPKINNFSFSDMSDMTVVL